MPDSLRERHQVVSAQSPSTPAQMQITLRQQQNKSSLSEVAPSMVKKVSLSQIIPGQEQKVLSLPEVASGIVKTNSNNTSVLGQKKQIDSSFTEPESGLTKNQTIPEQQKKVPSHSGTTSGILQLHKPSNHYEITHHPSKEITKTFDQSKVAPSSSLVKPLSDLVMEISDIVHTADAALVEKPKQMLVKYRDGYIYQTVNLLTDPKENINKVEAYIKQSNKDLVKPDDGTTVLSKASKTSDILEMAHMQSKKISDLVKDTLVQPKKIDILENICLQISNKIINKVREKSEITLVEPEKGNLKNTPTNEAQSLCTLIEEVVLSQMEKTSAEINKKIETENVDQPKVIVPLVQSNNKTDLRKILVEPTVIDMLENIPSQSRKESDQAQKSVKAKACETSPCKSRSYSRPLKRRFQPNTMKKNPKKRIRSGMAKTSKISSKKEISPGHITTCKFLKRGSSLEEECNSSDANCKFICGQCGKKYSHKRNLYRHIKYECNKKPQFQCSICSKGFTQNKTLKEHLTRIHDIRFLQSPDPPHETPGSSKPANGPNTPASSPSKDKTNQETPGSSFVEKIKLTDKTNYQETPASSPSKGDTNK